MTSEVRLKSSWQCHGANSSHFRASMRQVLYMTLLVWNAVGPSDVTTAELGSCSR